MSSEQLQEFFKFLSTKVREKDELKQMLADTTITDIRMYGNEISVFRKE